MLMGDPSQDPSMEEILASIKRVISEDAPPAAAPARRSPRADPPPTAEDDVLELDDPMPGNERLISEGAAAASRQSLAALSALRERPETASADESPIETMVKDMLRPMLKDWLDQNLPAIVEEIVAREVARITGKG
jgi:cell pole-organizing protein PopZ